MRVLVAGLGPIACLALLASCAASPTPDSASPSSSSLAPPSSSAPSVQLVNALVLTNGCQSMGRQSAALAESTMNALVEGCTSVPGGSMQFHATLQPGGRIEISAAPGQPEVVPICILKHGLIHRVPLTRACPLDVKIEQSTVPMVPSSLPSSLPSSPAFSPPSSAPSAPAPVPAQGRGS